MTIDEKPLNNGMILLGEKNLISIKKIEEKGASWWNYTEFCSFCSNFETTYGLHIPGIETFRDYCKVKRTEKEELWMSFSLKDDYDITKNGIGNLTKENFDIKIVKETLIDIELMSKSFVLAFNKNELKEALNIQKISKKVISKLEDISLLLIKKALWKKEGYTFELTYFKLNKKNLEANKFKKVFYGENLGNSGIRNCIENFLEEEYTKTLTTLSIPNTKTFLNTLWKELYLTPKKIKEIFPEIVVNDLKEIVELKYNDELELFSKNDFANEILLHEEGEIGKLARTHIKSTVWKVVEELKTK